MKKDLFEDLGLKRVGRLKPRPASEIKGNRIGVGFESLDRYHFAPEKTYPHLAKLGAKWARVQTGWNRCEREKGVYEFQWLDEVIDSLLNIEIQPFLTLGFGNLLYTPDAVHESARGYVAFYYGEEAAAAWREYVCRVVEHFRDRVKVWEVWNEPNTKGFWHPKPSNPEDYMHLLEETVPQVKKACPEAVIVGGVLASVRPMHSVPFLEKCLQAGMGEWIDKFGWHPYRSVPEQGYLNEVQAIRALLRQYAPHVGLWQAECGCQSKHGGLCEFLDIEKLNEDVQAKWVLRRIVTDLGLDLEYTQYFHTVDLFNYITDAGPTGKNQYMGLLRGNDYSEKPSFAALQALCALFDEDTKCADFICFPELVKGHGYAQRLDVAAIQAHTFSRNERPIYVYWYPTHFDRPLETTPITLGVWSSSPCVLKHPVLLDLMTRHVYAIGHPEESCRPGASNRFEVPLCDYPLILTDRETLVALLEDVRDD